LCSTNELFGLLGSRQITFTRAQWLLEMSTSSTSSPSSLSSLAHGPGFKSDEKEGLLIQNIVYICITLVSTSTFSFLHEPFERLLQDHASRLRPV
jgi:hypothetical protein